MNRLAGAAGGNVLRSHDPGLEPAGGDFATQPVGCRSRGVKADEFAPRGFERRRYAVKTVDERNLGLAPLARPIAGRARGRLSRLGGLRSRPPANARRRFARSGGRRTWTAGTLAGHPLGGPRGRLEK